MLKHACDGKGYIGGVNPDRSSYRKSKINTQPHLQQNNFANTTHDFRKEEI